MKKLFYLRVILCLLVFSWIAWGQMPQLEPYQHQNITLSIPQNWQVTKNDQAGTISISPDPEREDAPSIGVIVFDYIENANAEQIMASILPELQKQALEFNIIETYNIAEGGQGKIVLADYAEEINGQAVAGRMVLMIDIKKQGNLIALTNFSARTADFDRLDGLNLTTAVAGSIKRGETLLPNANQPSTNQNTSVPQGSLPTLNKQPQLVPYQDSNISAQIPEGWSVNVNPNDGTLTLKEHPTNPDSPIILLGVTQSNLSSSINGPILIDWIKQMLGNQPLHIVEEKPLTAGKIIVVDFDDFPIRVAALIEVEPQGRFTTLAMLAASQEGFSSLGGTSLLTSISQSARPTSVTSTAPTTSIQNASSPPNLILYQDELFNLQVPQGWQVKSNLEEASVKITKDPSNKITPVINIKFVRYYKTLDSLIDTLGSESNVLEVISEQEIVCGNTLSTMEGNSLPINMALLVVANPKFDLSLVFYLQSLTEEFEALGGASLLKTIAEHTQLKFNGQYNNVTDDFSKEDFLTEKCSVSNLTPRKANN